MKKTNRWCRLLSMMLIGSCLSLSTMAQGAYQNEMAPITKSETSPTATELAAWNDALTELFADKACTQLKAAYAGYTQAQMEADANYQALPTVLKKMVLKMTTDGTWDEANADSAKPAWDAEYAKRFRVQLIEPYCNKESAAQALGIQAHAYLNNPMGIYANNGDALYIMVEGEIKKGASLYVTTWTGHGKPGGDYTEGTQLKPGLNVVPIRANGSVGCINYTIHTLASENGKGNKALNYKLSDFEDLKVHIEGGYINGFYNVVGDELWGEGDNPADWDYYAARATHTGLTILGKYITLQFPFFDDETEGNKGTHYYFTGKNNIDKVVQEWDNVVLSERMVMGLAPKAATDEANATWKSAYSGKDVVIANTGDENNEFACDYTDYYNVHALAYGVGGSTYMYGSWDHSGYHYNTMSSILNDITTSAGSHWGPGHEIGHQHQQPLTLNGLTEVTNNLFANVVLWYFGKSTSRVNGDQGSLENVAIAFNTPGGDFYTNNIWALTHMYYRLFQYYHILGHNTSFYPRLYEMLRHDPMGRGYQQDGARGLLHFYKKACLAAGEDLTEFFRAHGMLTVMDNRFVGDYSNSIYNTTQEQIDEAIAFVKAQGFKESFAPLYINDGTGEEIIGSLGTKLDLYDGSKTADMGSYAHFYTPAGDYTFTFSNNRIVMKGEGGVGFMLKNEKNEVVGFANKRSFPISEAAAALLMSGKAKVYVVNGDNSMVEATTDIEKMQYNMLNTLLAKAEKKVKISDDTNTKVGFYKSAMLADVEAAVAAARDAYDAKNAAEYAKVYEALYNAMNALDANPDAVVSILPRSAYILENCKAEGTVMALNTSSKKLIGQKYNEKSGSQRWIFEPADEADCYYIKNKTTETYLDAIPDGKQGTAAAKTPEVAYKVIPLGDGLMAVQCQDEKNKSLNYNSGIGVLGWTHDGDQGSWWYITAVELNEAELARNDLHDVVGQTNELLREMGDSVLLPGAIALQAENAEAPFYIRSNADQNEVGTSTDGGGVKALLDGNTTTYFHSQWSGTAVKEDHYIEIDLGEGNAINELSLTYATRNAGDAGGTSPAPTIMKLAASNNGKTFTRVLGTYRNTDSKNPLPSFREMGKYWTSDNVKSTTGYRYFRITVTSSAGPGANSYGGHAFFAMSELSLNNAKAVVKSLKDEYTGAESIYEDVANYCYQASLVANDKDATDEEILNTLQEMKEKYATLVAASQGDLGIEGVITPVKQQRQGIYDLSGRRLQRIEQPGLYIINGQKQLIK